MRILSLINQKGGVGKTTLACHLALAARDSGKRVLLVDLDTQGSATAVLTQDVGLTQIEGGSAEIFFPGRPLEPRATPLGVDLLHGHQHLDRIDRAVKLDQLRDLRERFEGLPYDVIVIDSPPAIGPRHLGPLFWSDVVVTPLEPNSFAIQGLVQTVRTLQFVLLLNPALQGRIAINRHIRRSSRQQHYLRELQDALRALPQGLSLLEPYLTQRVAVGDALDQGLPVWSYRTADHRLRADWLAFCRGLIG